MKDKLKGAIAGIIIGVLLTATSVFAATGGVQKMLEYNNIKISLNGQEILPTDANGSYVEPFIIEGTTYLPVRAVANSLGLNVDWDGNTNTVLLSNTQAYTQPTGTVVYDKGGIIITYNGISHDELMEMSEINFLIENNSNNSVTVQTRNESVNGFMVSGFMSADVLPGKKANTTLSYFDSTLEENGITHIENIEFSFHIYNLETWDTIDDSEMITIAP